MSREGRLAAHRRTAEELDSIEHAGRVLVGDIDPFGEMGADGNEDRVEAALVAFGLQVGDAMVLLDGDTQRAQPVDLGVHDGAG